MTRDPRTEIYGPFDVLELLGVGGMATVHRAIERGPDGFQRVVALKRPLPHLADDQGFLAAFVHEAKLAALLDHPSIVRQYELGRVGRRCFISMEYIPGRDVRAIVRQARRVGFPTPVEVALALLGELLDALDHAHTLRGPDGQPLGMVHRDISPSNLIVSLTGQLKVIDFGVARASHAQLMTNTGRIKGKLAYMAPEALIGRIDCRSDLFSAAVTAHELLTALPLFGGGQDAKIIERVRTMQAPPPSSVNRTCPRELDEILLRGLAKQPAERWQSAAEMGAAVAELEHAGLRRASSDEVCSWVEWVFEMPPRELSIEAGGADGSSSSVAHAGPAAMADAWPADDGLADATIDDGPTVFQPPRERVIAAYGLDRRSSTALVRLGGVGALRRRISGLKSRWSLPRWPRHRSASRRWRSLPLVAAAVAVAVAAPVLWITSRDGGGDETRSGENRPAAGAVGRSAPDRAVAADRPLAHSTFAPSPHVTDLVTASRTPADAGAIAAQDLDSGERTPARAEPARAAPRVPGSRSVAPAPRARSSRVRPWLTAGWRRGLFQDSPAPLKPARPATTRKAGTRRTAEPELLRP